MRMGVRPPGVKEEWDDCSVWAQAQLIAFSQVMDHDENPPIKPAKKMR